MPLFEDELRCVFQNFPCEAFRHRPEIILELTLRMISPDEDVSRKAIEHLTFFIKQLKKRFWLVNKDEFNFFEDENDLAIKNGKQSLYEDDYLKVSYPKSQGKIKGNLKEITSWTFYDLFSYVLTGTFDCIEMRKNIGSVFGLWKEAMGFLESIKNFAFEEVSNLISYFLSIFNNVTKMKL